MNNSEESSAQKLSELVHEFCARAKESQAVLSAINEALKIEPESPLNEAFYSLAGGYVQAIDAAFPGAGGWVEWFWADCDLGEKPLKARISDKEEWRTIATPDDLAKIIFDDLKKAKD